MFTRCNKSTRGGYRQAAKLPLASSAIPCFPTDALVRGIYLPAGPTKGDPPMNGSTAAPEKRGEVILSLSTVQRMLPLIQRIVEDILLNQKALDRLAPEQNQLDRQRRTLAWPE